MDTYVSLLECASCKSSKLKIVLKSTHVVVESQTGGLQKMRNVLNTSPDVQHGGLVQLLVGALAANDALVSFVVLAAKDALAVSSEKWHR